MRNYLFTAALATWLVLTAPVLADEIYRWVDSEGQVHYSDIPREGAEQLELDPAQTFVAPKKRSATATPKSAPEQPAETSKPVAGQLYTEFAIASPAQEETIWNTGGAITISVRVTPELQPDHSVYLYLDRALIESKEPGALSVELPEVFRGEHIVTAEIRNASGQVVKTAPAVTFYYRQTSVAANCSNLDELEKLRLRAVCF